MVPGCSGTGVAPGMPDAVKTSTCTRTREQSDVDRQAEHFTPIPRSAEHAGRDHSAPSLTTLDALKTETKTATRESSDQDPWAFSAHATQTITETREQRDQDRASAGFHILPRIAACS